MLVVVIIPVTILGSIGTMMMMMIIVIMIVNLMTTKDIVADKFLFYV